MYFLVAVDKVGAWRWTLYSLDHKKIAESSEGFVSRVQCEVSVELVMATNSGTPIRYTP